MIGEDPQPQQSAIDKEALEIHLMSHERLLDTLLSMYYETAFARRVAEFDTVEKNQRKLGMMREEALRRMSLIQGRMM